MIDQSETLTALKRAAATGGTVPSQVVLIEVDRSRKVREI
jgi:hypothetical protein